MFLFQRDMDYKIVQGNESNKFQLIKKYGVWALHFKRRLKHPDAFDLTIHGRPTDSQDYINDVYEKPLALRLKLNVLE